MNDREPNRRTNDALQSSEGNLALGDEERDFGAGRQRTNDPLTKTDAPKRKVGRDPTVPRGQEHSPAKGVRNHDRDQA